jgi:hypothetical protein
MGIVIAQREEAMVRYVIKRKKIFKVLRRGNNGDTRVVDFNCRRLVYNK